MEDEGEWDRDIVRNAFYHTYCVVTHLFVEDEALDGSGPLHVLDDCGDVARQCRADSEGGDDNYEEFEFRGEVGSVYCPGGPHTLWGNDMPSPNSRLLRFILYGLLCFNIWDGFLYFKTHGDLIYKTT